MASDKRAFIPKDKPKSWVIFVLATLIGLGVGLIGALLMWGGFPTLAYAAMALFVACWLVAASAWVVFAVGSVSGAYKNLSPKPWSEQKW